MISLLGTYFLLPAKHTQLTLYFLLTPSLRLFFCILFAEVSFIFWDSYKILLAHILPLRAKPTADGPGAGDAACMVAQTWITVHAPPPFSSGRTIRVAHCLVFPQAGPVPRFFKVPSYRGSGSMFLPFGSFEVFEEAPRRPGALSPASILTLSTLQLIGSNEKSAV